MDEGNVSVRGDSLLLRGAEVEDSAKYTCVVGNVAGLDKLSSIVKIIGWYYIQALYQRYKLEGQFPS